MPRNLTLSVRQRLTSTRQSLRRLSRRFRRDTDGVVSIEFAFVVPVLIAIYFGLVQISLVVMQDRRVSHATSVIGDLATRVSSVDEAEVANIMQAAIAVMQVNNPNVLSSGQIQMQLVSFKQLTDGTYDVIGRAQTAGWTEADVDPAKIDKRLLSQTSGALVARVRYKYDFKSTKGSRAGFSTGLFGKDGIKLEETFILKPRLTSNLPFASDSGNGDDDFSCTISGTGQAICDGYNAARQQVTS